MKDQAYKVYLKMRERRLHYLNQRSKSRREGKIEDAKDYGDRAAVVSECMDIIKKEFHLTFS